LKSLIAVVIHVVVATLNDLCPDLGRNKSFLRHDFIHRHLIAGATPAPLNSTVDINGGTYPRQFPACRLSLGEWIEKFDDSELDEDILSIVALDESGTPGSSKENCIEISTEDPEDLSDEISPEGLARAAEASKVVEEDIKDAMRDSLASSGLPSVNFPKITNLLIVMQDVIESAVEFGHRLVSSSSTLLPSSTEIASQMSTFNICGQTSLMIEQLENTKTYCLMLAAGFSQVCDNVDLMIEELKLESAKLDKSMGIYNEVLSKLQQKVEEKNQLQSEVDNLLESTGMKTMFEISKKYW
jgi:hypothetical protein